MTYPISERANTTVENHQLIHNITKLANQLNIDSSNKTYGISSHEKTHLLHTLQRYLDRVNAILKEEVR